MSDRGVDPQTLDLARHFLSDLGAERTILADLLAERIQGAVEDWFEEMTDEEIGKYACTCTGRNGFHAKGCPANTAAANPVCTCPNFRDVGGVERTGLADLTCPVHGAAARST